MPARFDHQGRRIDSASSMRWASCLASSSPIESTGSVCMRDVGGTQELWARPFALLLLRSATAQAHTRLPLEAPVVQRVPLDADERFNPACPFEPWRPHECTHVRTVRPPPARSIKPGREFFRGAPAAACWFPQTPCLDRPLLYTRAHTSTKTPHTA